MNEYLCDFANGGINTIPASAMHAIKHTYKNTIVIRHANTLPLLIQFTRQNEPFRVAFMLLDFPYKVTRKVTKRKHLFNLNRTDR